MLIPKTGLLEEIELKDILENYLNTLDLKPEYFDNKDMAIKQLKAKLYEMEELKRKEKAQSVEESKADIGWGSQIRSYVLDASRIKDLRTNIEITNTGAVLDGELDPFIEASLKMGL